MLQVSLATCYRVIEYGQSSKFPYLTVFEYLYILMDITHEKLFYIRVLLLTWLEYVRLVLLSDMSRIVNLSAKLRYHFFIFELASKRQFATNATFAAASTIVRVVQSFQFKKHGVPYNNIIDTFSYFLIEYYTKYNWTFNTTFFFLLIFLFHEH